MENKGQKRICGISWGLIAIFLLGVFLRFLNLGGQGVWLDEGFSWLKTQVGFGELTRLSLSDTHPPLYYWTLKASLLVLPGTEFGIRVVSVLCSLATMIVLIAFVYRHWGHRAACCVGLLAAVSPFDIYYAQEARMYAMLSFFFVPAFTELVESLEGNPAHLIGWVAANIGLAWTHAYGVLVVFLQLGFVALYWTAQYLGDRPSRLKIQTIMAAVFSLLLGIAPILVFFWVIRSKHSAGASLPQIKTFAYLIRYWAVGQLDAFPAYKIPWGLRDASVIMMIICALLGGWHLWKCGELYHWILLFAIALILLPATLVLVSSTLTKRELWVDRGFLGSAQIFYLLAGIGLSALGSRALRTIAAVTIGVSILSGEVFYYTRFEKCRSALAFHALPPLTSQRALLVIPPRNDCEAYFYLRTFPSFWGVQAKPPWHLRRVTRGAAQAIREPETTCDEADIKTVTEFYAYGDASDIRANRRQWPTCLQTKKIWVYEDLRWHLLNE